MACAPKMSGMEYPRTRRDDLIETLHGVSVPDPYRWLEDADDPQVQVWAAEQQAVTEAQLSQLPVRAWFRARCHAEVARPRAGMPVFRWGRYVLSRNDGSHPQDVWYTAPTLEELLAGGEVLLDPNTWSEDGTSSLSTFSVSRDGTKLAYARNDAGSDWQHIRVRELSSGRDVGEPVTAKFTEPEWLPDGASFLYTTFDEATDARGSATTGLGAARLMVHRLGATDELLVSFPDEPQTMAYGQVSQAGDYLLVSIGRGTEATNRLWVYPLTTSGATTTWGEPVKVIDTADATYSVVRCDGEALTLFTTLDAPLGRIVRVDLARARRGELEFTEVVPQRAATLVDAVPAGDGMLLGYLDDAKGAVAYLPRDGSKLTPVPLPAGALKGLDGHFDQDEAFVAISTLTTPSASFRLVVPSQPGAPVKVEPLTLVSDAAPRPEYALTRRRATSADGTEVPYFLAVPDDGREGPRPTLLYGYGGFKIPVGVDYRTGWSAWLAAGGALAIANLRGGGEYGESWYDDGRLANKQNVFDDVIAVAEHLIETGATSASGPALHGRSNGGLLVGAAMTQRPDLFAAALPTVGVLDVLRFHKFTIGAAWISDYGDPDTPDGFAVTHAYSPLHHVVHGTAYPPTLVSTADHDDRVVPLHSYKFAAALQAAQGADAPVLLRVDIAAGHGAGKPLGKIAAEWTDLLSFAAAHTGLDPSSRSHCGVA